jgi:NAD+ synthase
MKLDIAVCTVNPTVGDLDGNVDLIIAAYDQAAARGASIAVMPEMVVTGYPIEDLTQNAAFLADAEAARQRIVAHIRAHGGTTALLFGHPTDTGRHDGNRRLVHNSATLVDPKNPDLQVTHKRNLPSYGVFDEKRDYLEGPPPRIMQFRGLRLGVLICEDGWFEDVPRSLAAQGADVMLWLNGSPFAIGKNVIRRNHGERIFIQSGVPVVYVNLVGGQDELVFDGDSFSFDGERQWQGPLFKPFVEIVRMDVQRQQATRPLERLRPLKCEATGIAQVYQALVQGVRDYLGKSRFKKVLLGYSGGVDSGLVAAIAVDALGPENVLLVRLPSKYSSDGSKDDAWVGAERLGCPMRTIDIEPMVEASRAAYAAMDQDFGHAPSAKILTGVSDENIQARARGNILMAISNQEGMMLLNTTNRTEALTGFGTLHGDMAGGFGPLKDVPKTMVWALCRHRNALQMEDLVRCGFEGPVTEVVPEEIIVKPPSAELRPDQQDTDSLPPYPILDAVIASIIDRERSVADTVTDGIADIATVKRVQHLVYTAEYKRRLAAPGIKIGNKLVGKDRRYPIINGYRDSGRAA